MEIFHELQDSLTKIPANNEHGKEIRGFNIQRRFQAI